MIVPFFYKHYELRTTLFSNTKLGFKKFIKSVFCCEGSWYINLQILCYILFKSYSSDIFELH